MGESVKRASVEKVEGVLLREHAWLNRELNDALNEVPLTGEQGKGYGERLNLLTWVRDQVEESLSELGSCRPDVTRRLCGMAVTDGKVTLGDDGEVLQTTIVSLDSVRQDLSAWKGAMMNEYRSLTEETGAIEAVNVADLREEEVEFVPGKLVCSVKAGPNGGRKKCRGVICGNLLDQAVDPAPWGSYASGADGLMIRSTLRHGTLKGWGVSTTDIKTAFLLAPRPKPEGAREVIVIPPKIMVQAGVCTPSERWRVHKALYGFPSSPARWSVHRDQTLKEFFWESNGLRYHLQSTPEGNLWKVIETNDQDSMQCVGHIIVYVDDVMIVAPNQVREGFLGRLKREWAIAEPETVGKDGWVRFCGFELRWLDDENLAIGQPSYTKDLIERHGVTVSRSSPMPKVEIPEEPEENLTATEVKAAQALTGELLWLSIRSRPDIAFAVATMSRNLSKFPRWVVRVGKSVLEYLAGTPKKALVYGPCRRDRGPLSNLPITRHEELIEAYADISFAPQGGRSSQGIALAYAGMPVQWEASRQPFCAMSTAESELLGYCEAMQVVQALESLLTILHGKDNFEKLMCGDNSSAIAILTKPDGPWRTRHLRLRSHCLKEKLTDPKGDWLLRHQKGTELIADFLTKPITVPTEWERFGKFMNMRDVGIGSETSDGLQSFASDDLQNQGVTVCTEEPAVAKERLAKVGLAAGMMGMLAEVAPEPWRRGVQLAALALLMLLLARGTKMDRVQLADDFCEGSEEGSKVPALARCELVSPNATRMSVDRETVCEGWNHQKKKEESGTSRAEMRDQEKQKAREDEPARNAPLRDDEPRVAGVLREDEPKISQELREENEPNSCDGRRKVKNVAGEALEVGDVVGGARSFVWENDSFSCDHCPSGCPVASESSIEGPLAMDSSSRMRISHKPRVAAMRVPGTSVEAAWLREQYQRPPSHSRDSWVDTWLAEGWLLRAHGSYRVRCFHPLHRGVPVEVAQLSGERISIGIFENGERLVVKDRWTDPPKNLVEPKRRWRGWTFLKLKVPVMPGFGTPQSSSSTSRTVSTAVEGRVRRDDQHYFEASGSGHLQEPFLFEATVGDVNSEVAQQSWVGNPGELRRGYQRGSVSERGRDAIGGRPVLSIPTDPPLTSTGGDLPLRADFPQADDGSESSEGWEKISEV